MVVDALTTCVHDVRPVCAPKRPLACLCQRCQLCSNTPQKRRLRYKCHGECDFTTVPDFFQVVSHKSELALDIMNEGNTQCIFVCVYTYTYIYVRTYTYSSVCVYSYHNNNNNYYYRLLKCTRCGVWHLKVSQ